ncbi:hypothetical protein BTV99_09850 [Psychrobacter sp. Rd 27.2]|nr:hypothetical protein BTV99_09850 [Psychrobacter sp. Rd 27.2]
MAMSYRFIRTVVPDFNPFLLCNRLLVFLLQYHWPSVFLYQYLYINIFIVATGHRYDKDGDKKTATV